MNKNRLLKYNKPVLVELVEELRDRFDAIHIASEDTTKQIGLLHDRIKRQKEEIKKLRKLHRDLLKSKQSFGYMKPKQKIPISAERIKQAQAQIANGDGKGAAETLRTVREALEAFEIRLNNKPIHHG